MPLEKLEHYLVLSDDMEATRDFYTELLCLETGFRPDLGFPGYWIYLGDTPVIHIAEWESYRRYGADAGVPVSERGPGTGPLDHIAFNGTDPEDMIRRLEARGLAYQRNDVPGAGLRQLFLNDPNGLKIELNYRVGD
jgi:catechol 2,3-dioxygenase-like lactoylglutathione lyase family enzyme